MKTKIGRPSKREKKLAGELHERGASTDTIADRLKRSPSVVAGWNAERARASAHAAASGLPPPADPNGASASTSTPPPAAAPGAAPGAGFAAGQLTPAAVVGTFEVVRACILEGACVAAKVDSAHPRLAGKLELPQRHRELLEFCSPVLIPVFSRWLANETAALGIACGVMVASTLPVALAIRQLGRELKRDRDAAERARKEADAVAARNGGTPA